MNLLVTETHNNYVCLFFVLISKFRPFNTDDTEEDPSHKTFEANRGPGQLRSCTQRVFLRQAPRSICTNTKLLQVLLSFLGSASPVMPNAQFDDGYVCEYKVAPFFAQDWEAPLSDSRMWPPV